MWVIRFVTFSSFHYFSLFLTILLASTIEIYHCFCVNNAALAVADSDKIIPLHQPENRDESVWEKSPTANLIKYKPSGVYFVRATVNGRRIGPKSLKTTSYSIAQTKLAQFLNKERGRVAVTDVPDENMRFEHLATEYLQRLENDPTRRERSVDYRRDSLKCLRSTWPGIDKLKANQVTYERILAWAYKQMPEFSPSWYNGLVQTIRGVMQVAVDRGILAENPAKSRKRNSKVGIPAAYVPIREPKLPSQAQFEKLFAELKRIPERAKASKMIRFMAYCGCRISAARLMTPENIDMEKGVITLPKVKYDREPVRVPMIPEMKELCAEMLKDHVGNGPIFTIADPKKALMNSCRDAGIPIISAHKLRHAFVSRCIECGVDILTISKWCGHKDGGKLLSRVYAHLREEHSMKMAEQVRFT